jgi:hypothetical protein
VKSTPLFVSRFSFWQQWLVHWLVLWTLICAVEGTLGPWQRAWHIFLDYPEALSLALGLLLVEASYHFVFRRVRLALFLGGALAAAVSVGLLVLALTSWRDGSLGHFPGGVVIRFLIYLVGYALVRDGFYRRSRQAEARVQQSEMELAALRAQLNPHFFFNTLNTLYGTALEESAARTAECIERLAGLLRYTLREAQHEVVAVAEEIAFLEAYLALQRLRLPIRPQLEVRTHVHYDGQPATIGPLLLLPFLENAFTYGISLDQPCFLHLALTIEQGVLTLDVENRILPSRNWRAGAGTGLRHVRQRLALLYPHCHTLRIQETGDTFVVHLRIELPTVALSRSLDEPEGSEHLPYQA